MLQADAVKLIQDTAKESQAAKLLPEIPGDGRTAFVWQAGELIEIQVPPPVRRHEVHSLDDLVNYAKAIHEANTDSEAAPRLPVAWHGAKGVTLVIDDSDRRDLVHFGLTLSKRFAVLQKLEKDKPAFEQGAFVRLLRIDLGLDNNRVVYQFRKLDWSTGDDGVGQIEHARAKIGKAITAKVEGIAELPEELDVVVPVYQQSGERQEYIVRCAVEIDTINRRFQLLPLADELERVLDLAQASIRTRLNSEIGADSDVGIPVYYGEP